MAGRLVLVYYDQRLDHTLAFHIPNNPFAPDAQGRFYLVRGDAKGELPAHPEQVFTLGIDDATLTSAGTPSICASAAPSSGRRPRSRRRRFPSTGSA